MPGVGAYLVWPSARALAQASLTNSGVSKSGSPTPKPTTSLPAALRAFALASTARVGEGATLRAQEERAGFDMAWSPHAKDSRRIGKTE